VQRRAPWTPSPQDVNKTVKTLDRLLKTADAKTLPGVSLTLDRLDGTLAMSEHMLKDTNATLLGPDAPCQQELRLGAVWTVRRTRDGRSETGGTSLREPVEGAGSEALAAAHSRAQAALSRDIADAAAEADRRGPAGDVGNAD
jgi:hypothetical protein